MASIVNHFLGWFQGNCILRPTNFTDPADRGRHDHAGSAPQAGRGGHGPGEDCVPAPDHRDGPARRRRIGWELYGLTAAEVGIVEAGG